MSHEVIIIWDLHPLAIVLSGPLVPMRKVLTLCGCVQWSGLTVMKLVAVVSLRALEHKHIRERGGGEGER